MFGSVGTPQSPDKQGTFFVPVHCGVMMGSILGIWLPIYGYKLLVVAGSVFPQKAGGFYGVKQ